MRPEHVTTLRESKPLSTVVYFFEIRDSFGKVVQTGQVKAGDNHIGAAYAALAISLYRTQTAWVVRVARKGGTKTGSYFVERLDIHKVELTRIRPK